MCEANLPITTNHNLPAITDQTLFAVSQITAALGVPREVLASDENIQFAWINLPRELSCIPSELRSDLLARMCVAVATGLFDGAINYIWNASIVQLRQKIRDFGLNVVTQILGRAFEEKNLIEQKDADLLTLCLELNLISEEGYFFLDQNRDIRNNFSAAHPNMGLINDRELLVFINRCAKYALSAVVNPRGVDISDFIQAIKGAHFIQSQLDTWLNRLRETHDAQRELLFVTLQGIYCDPASTEEARINALLISQSYCGSFSSKTKSDILDRHHDYQAKGDVQRHSASRLLLEKLGLLSLLNTIERHAIISLACERMLSVHMAFDNFYNEPPFASRLLELSGQGEIPESTKEKFVLTTITCYVGNQYGVSNAAIPYYEKIIRSFTPMEISILIGVPNTNTVLANRMRNHNNCRQKFKNAVSLINSKSVPSSIRSAYDQILN